jgi:hypothetical protein
MTQTQPTEFAIVGKPSEGRGDPAVEILARNANAKEEIRQ